MCQEEANERWKELKSGDKSSFKLRVSDYLKELTSVAKKKKGVMLQYFSALPHSCKYGYHWHSLYMNVHLHCSSCTITRSPAPTLHRPSTNNEIPLEFAAGSSQFQEPNDENIDPVVTSQPSRKRSFSARAQDEIQLKIDLLNADLVGLLKRKTTGWLTAVEEKDLSEKQKAAHVLQLSLKEKQDGQRRAKKFRDSRKKN